MMLNSACRRWGGDRWRGRVHGRKDRRPPIRSGQTRPGFPIADDVRAHAKPGRELNRGQLRGLTPRPKLRPEGVRRPDA
jgi:hypothetical protein